MSKIDHQQAIKELSAQLELIGYKVRREQLKKGTGWKAISGTCRVNEDRVIFLDRKMPPDEQILFLRSILQRDGELSNLPGNDSSQHG